jgi:hypothetical protein
MRIIASLLLSLVLQFAGAAYADEITPSESVVTGVIIRSEPHTSSERLAITLAGTRGGRQRAVSGRSD